MSQIATFFVPLSDGEASLEELNAFLRVHRVLQTVKAFTGNGWSVCVEWLEGGRGGPAYSQRRVDYREVLDEATFARFSRMRERRKAIALEDGVPPYMVMTDAQIAEAVKDGEPTVDTLKKVSSFGEARLAKYAARLCAAGAEAPTAQEPGGAGAPSPAQGVEPQSGEDVK